MATIYRKTAAGADEIQHRWLGLTPRHRHLLIVVDGRRDDDELSSLLASAQAPLLQQLLDLGLIEAIGETQARPDTGPHRGGSAP